MLGASCATSMPTRNTIVPFRMPPSPYYTSIPCSRNPFNGIRPMNPIFRRIAVAFLCYEALQTLLSMDV
jgi:hypothetical protein